MDHFIRRFIQFSSPFSIPEMENMRIRLMEEMINKSFGYYMKQMKDLVQAMKYILDDPDLAHKDKLILDDDYWVKHHRMSEPYWIQESPWLKDMFSGKFYQLYNNKGKIISLTTSKLNRGVIKHFLGDPFWMTAQQKIFFRAMILTYYRYDIRLWPIHINIDYTFQKSLQSVSKKKNNTWQIKKLLKKKGSQELNYMGRVIVSLVKSALSGSGPFILKVLQQVNTSNTMDFNGVKVADITGDVFSNVPGLIPQEVELLKNNLGVRKEFIDNMDPKILGSASISETHRTHDNQGHQAVIKIIKPIYAYYFLCEINFLLTTVWKMLREETMEETSDPVRQQIFLLQTRKFLMYITQEFVKEFDYTSEFIHTTLGYRIYNRPSKGLQSIVALDFQENPLPGLVLQFVNGISLDDLYNHPTRVSKEDWKLIYERILTLHDIWYTEALWGSGFIHTDLHPGNIIWTTDKQLALIDYGSSVMISPKTQCLLIDAMFISGNIVPIPDSLKYTNYKKWNKLIRLREKSAKKFVEKIWQICQVTSYTSKDVDTMTRGMLAKSNLFFSNLFLFIVEHSNDIGICVHSDVLMFGRGVAYLHNVLENIIQHNPEFPYFHITSIVEKNLRRHPAQLLKLLSNRSTCTKSDLI